MTNPAYEATNSDVPHLINEAKRSSFVMEYISNFQPEDIDSDDVDLRFEADGVDTGCDVSIVDQCGKAATLIDALIAALEKAQRQERKAISELQTLGEEFGCPGGVRRIEWLRVQLKHIGRLEKSNAERSSVLNEAYHRIAELEAAPNGMMQLSNELAEMKRKCVELELKLAKPVILPKTNGYWTEQEKAYEDAITLAKRQVRLAGFRCEGDD